MTRPAASAALASGTVIERNSWRSDAPSTRAASSRSRSTPAIPVRAERTKNGADTKIWARITATVVNGTEMPRISNGADEQPAAAEDEEQGEAGDRRRQHDRQVDDRLEPALAAERPPGEDDRERQAEGHGHDEADRRRHRLSQRAVEDDRRRRARPGATRRGSTGRRGRGPAARGTARTGRRARRPSARPNDPDRSVAGRGAARHVRSAPGRSPRDVARSRRRRQEPEIARGSPGRRDRRTSRGRPWPPPAFCDALTTTPS